VGTFLDSMHRRPLWHRLHCIAATLVMTGCTTTAAVHGAREQEPLATTQDARVGIVYTGAARGAEYADPLVRVLVGHASVTRLDQAFAVLFNATTRLPDWPPWRSVLPPVDGVIEVDAASMSVTMGMDYKRPETASVLLPPIAERPDQVTIRYRACLLQPGGQVIACWEATAQSDHQRGVLESYAKSVADAADRAMSGATAKLMLAIENDPEVKAWLVSIGKARH
jgi:hypothetical protein